MAKPLFVWKGGPELERTLKKFRSTFRRELKKELSWEIYRLMRDAQDKVPKEAGSLSSSVFTGTPYSTKNSVGVRGGYTDPKAAAVHEGIHGGRHVKAPNAHWFSQAFYEFKPGFQQRLTARVKELMAMAARAKEEG